MLLCALMRETLASLRIKRPSRGVLGDGRASVTSLLSNNLHDVTGDAICEDYSAWGNLQLLR